MLTQCKTRSCLVEHNPNILAGIEEITTALSLSFFLQKITNYTYLRRVVHRHCKSPSPIPRRFRFQTTGGSLTSSLLGFVHLYGEAGSFPAAGVCAVGSTLERSRTGTLRCQNHVMVYPLTPLHQQVRQGGVQRNVVVVSEQHLLRNQTHLQHKESEE